MSKCWCGLLLLVAWIGSGGTAHAAVTETPDPIDIGQVIVGASKTADGMLSDIATRTVTLQLATGGDCAQFQIISATSLTIGTTPSTVTVRLTPASNGVKNCTITVTGGTSAKTFGVTGTGAAPQISVDPTSLPFANVDVGLTSPTQRVTATNTGTATLTITNAMFTIGGSNYSVTGNTGSQTVLSGDSVHWDIACAPQAKGTVNGTFQISSNSVTGNPTNVAVTCTGDQGLIGTDQPSLDFGQVLLNTSQTRTVTLTNPGDAAVTSITGQLSSSSIGYSIDPSTPVPSTLNPGDAIPVTIKFTPVNPTDGGPATLTFSGAWHGHVTTAMTSLAGQAVSASLSLSTNTIAFGTFRFDTVPQQTFQIINTGSAAIPIQSVSLTADPGTDPAELPVTIKLGGTSVALPASIPVGQQFVVTVTARPSARTGLVGGTFVVHSSLAGISDQRVTVTGTATAAMLDATATVDFGGVDLDVAAASPPKMTATITNTGMASLGVSAVTIASTSGTASAFTFTNPLPATPISLAPNSTLVFEVTYKPTVERGPADVPDTVVLGASLTGLLGGPATQMITIRGHGIDRHLAVPADPTFPPTFRNPGDRAPIRALTVQNNGEALLKITAVRVTGDPVWQLVDGSSVDIPGGASHDFMVKFSPTDVGLAPVGELTLMSNDNLNQSKTVMLTGEGVKRDVAFGPDPDPTVPIDLGVTGVGARITATDVLAVTNLDPDVAFTIHVIQLDGDPAFSVDGAPTDVALPAATAKRFAISFQPTAVGDFTTIATLFLDQDPEAQATVQLTGHAVSIDVHGGGGCAAGHDAGGGAMILVLVAGLARTRRRRATTIAVGMDGVHRRATVIVADFAAARGRCAAVIVVALAVLPARVLADDVRVGAFDPTPATTGTGLQLESADVGNAGDWVASGVVSYATNPMIVGVSSGGGVVEQRPIARSTMVELGGAYAFLGRFEAGVRMPLYSQRGDVAGGMSDMGVVIPAASGTALGDLTLHAKARLVDRAPWTAGAAVHVTLPTSTKDQFTGVDLPTLRVLGLATVTPIARLTLSFNGGAVLRKTADYRKQIFIEQGSGLAWGAGASVRVADRLFATGEVFGELVPKSKAMTGSVSPIEGLVGASYRAERWFTVGFAVGRGLSSGLGAPELRGTFTLSFTSGTGGLAPPERDPPSVRVAAAATAAPEPALDSDHDGIPDERDRCPDQPEDKDGFQDDDGCPDPDNDGDGIPDAQDKCPDQPETFNGVQDDDGCPDVGDTSATVGVTPGQSPKKAAEDTFLRGRELMTQRKYAAACAAFEQSQHLDPAAGTRYNLAGCYAEIGKLATAWTMYRELARSDKNAERRAKSNELANQLTPRVPRLKMVLHGTPAGVNVFMNANDANALIGIETPVDLGTYAIVAGAPNHRGWHKTVEVNQEAEVITIDIDLGPELAP